VEPFSRAGRGTRGWRLAIVRDRVALLLVAAGLLAAWGLPFLSHAPNRLLSGQPIALASMLAGPRLFVLIPGLLVAASPFLPDRRTVQVLVAAGAAVLLFALVWLAGNEAARLAETAPRAARTSLGSAFWVLCGCLGLMVHDELRRVSRSLALRSAIAAVLFLAIGGLLAAGSLAQLSLLREYAAHPDLFAAALLRHAVIVALALVPAVLLGVPLGIAAERRQRVRGVLFPLLNLIQTIPSIALFGLLIAPLSALATAVPALGAAGIGGVGVAPAVIALMLYSLLPVARGAAAGLASVPAAAVEAARAIGMTPRQMLWRVEMPLALPVILAGLRVAAVQAIGLTAVAALIGAGGFGAIIFQGLFANALDLVLLGIVPMVALALAVDTMFALAAAASARVPR
jgi:osmoprotectant transport system permease protein